MVAKKPDIIERGVWADRLKMVAEPTRIGLLLGLVEGERNVTQLLTEFGGSQPALSYHLAILKAGGLIQGQHRQKFIAYSLTPKGMATVAALKAMTNGG